MPSDSSLNPTNVISIDQKTHSHGPLAFKTIWDDKQTLLIEVELHSKYIESLVLGLALSKRAPRITQGKFKTGMWFPCRCEDTVDALLAVAPQYCLFEECAAPASICRRLAQSGEIRVLVSQAGLEPKQSVALRLVQPQFRLAVDSRDGSKSSMAGVIEQDDFAMRAQGF